MFFIRNRKAPLKGSISSEPQLVGPRKLPRGSRFLLVFISRTSCVLCPLLSMMCRGTVVQCSLPNKAHSFSSSSSCFWNLNTCCSAAIIGRSRCQGSFWAITRVQTSLPVAPHHAPSAGDRTVQQLLMGKTGSLPHSQRALLFKQQSQVHMALASQENTSFPPRMPAGSLTHGAGGENWCC